jgi:hypothetical protein
MLVNLSLAVALVLSSSLLHGKVLSVSTDSIQRDNPPVSRSGIDLVIRDRDDWGGAAPIRRATPQRALAGRPGSRPAVGHVVDPSGSDRRNFWLCSGSPPSTAWGRSWVDCLVY